MRLEQAEKLFEYVLEGAFCSKDGCWPNGYSTHVIEFNGGFAMSAWPDVGDDGEYDAANFDILGICESAKDLIRVHYTHNISMLQTIWVDQGTWLVLNLFMDPPDKEVFNNYVLDHNHKLKNLIETKTIPKGASVQIDAGQIGFQELVDMVLEKTPVPTPDLVSVARLCDMLITSGKDVDEDTINMWTKDQFLAAYRWSTAVLVGSVSPGVEPQHILALENIVG